MSDVQTMTGTVLSHTTIRVAGKLHAERAPFVLLLVASADGRNLLGQFDQSEPPAIGTKVVARNNSNPLVFVKA